MKQLTLDDGYTTATEPDQGEVNSTRARSYANSTAYEAYLTAQGLTLANGHWFYNSTDHYFEQYVNGAWRRASLVDIGQTSFTIANHQATPANVTGFDVSSYTSFTAFVEVARYTDTAGSEVMACGFIHGFKYPSAGTWNDNEIEQLNGDAIGVTFSLTGAGQLQYTSTFIDGDNYVGTMKFKVTAMEA